ncbi:helix-turn-helix domain-containing protein [Streptomyces sp. A1136]|uniref:helix-turn-helix domain-containing protein n=1 Tax=Streptomyces sp. A1136 TaxID=2563102 RepID=UPI00109EDB28|nr:helix-turn-helix domain-containing protein [Streptomyces sp. A1136]THA56360.1 helix-turn-helix domain-containing protein [Streptomyces sp. A1136]
MDTQKPNPVVLASGRNRGDAPRSGVVHVNVRHTRRFTVVGNHLAQHAEMSLVAIGLALHIQSLPAGTRIGIKDLAARFPESEHRIARALRELEVYGYLERTRVRLPGGQVITRTVSYNRPGCAEVDENPAPPPAPAPVAAPVADPPPAAPPAAAPEPLPRPLNRDNPWRHEAAVTVLTDLRRLDSRLLLGRQDIERLAPAVEAWLERGARPGGITAALTANLPPQPRNPAGLVAYRLAAQLPPALADVPRPAAHVPPDPFQTCEDEACGLAFRSREPGLCGECRAEAGAA